MKTWELDFTGNWSTGFVLVLAVLCIGLSHVFYRQKRARLSPRIFIILNVLRTMAIIIIAIFLLKPIIRFTRTEKKDTEVIVLIDVSESMGIKDSINGLSRLDGAQELLHGEQYHLLEALEDIQKVRLFSFGSYTAEVPEGRKLTADHKATAIGEAMQEAVAHVGENKVSALVLLTDGVNTTGTNPLEVAQFLGAPVFVVALGGTQSKKGEFCDVGIGSMPHNLEFIVNNKATIAVRITNFGLQDRSPTEREVKLVMKKGKEELASKMIQFPKQNASREVEIDFSPKELGIHKFTLELPLLRGETVRQNNVRNFTVRVTDPKIRTLLVEGVVRTEYKFLRTVLESDPNIELTSVIKIHKKVFNLQGVQPGVDLSYGLPTSKEAFKKFDVVILGDISRREFHGAQLECLKDFVGKGGGLLVMGGYKAYGAGGWAGSPIAEVLPVTIKGPQDGHAEGTFMPRLTPTGQRHPVFAGCAEFFAAGSQRAVLDGVNRVVGVKLAAEVLAVHPKEMIRGRTGLEPMPIATVQRYGDGFVLALTADTTWKWKFQIEARGLDSPYYRFWRQSVRWLAGHKDKASRNEARLSAWSNKIEYPQGETVVIEARVLDKKNEPDDNATVEAKIHYPMPMHKVSPRGEKYTEDSVTVQFDHIPLSLGTYRVSFMPRMSGIYRVEVAAAATEGKPEDVEIEFVVGQAVTEFDRVDIDELTMQGIASETRGQYYTVAKAGDIAQHLEKKRRRVVQPQEMSLWNAPGFFLVFLACVSLEWALRKKFGLN